MAELENIYYTPAAQAGCCDPSDKAECCWDGRAAGCGCSAGSTSTTATAVVTEQVRETVREKYAAAARETAAGGGCCSPADETGVFGSVLYAGEEGAPEAAVSASLG